MKRIINEQEKVNVILFLVFIGCIGITLLKPIAQNPSYHIFADSREFVSVPNFWNVISNVPFLLIGIFGMYYVLYKTKLILQSLQLNYFIFFTGIFLTGLGSGYYHLNPNNYTLVWDRLPMTISFMSFFSIIISEFISMRNARLILFALLFLGITSVIYWNISESHGCGDLRLYIAVQFLPIILIPIILLLFKPVGYNASYLWLVLLMYVLAKTNETFDQQIFHALKFISGHSLKHIFAASAPLIFLFGIRQLKMKTAGSKIQNKKTG